MEHFTLLLKSVTLGFAIVCIINSIWFGKTVLVMDLPLLERSMLCDDPKSRVMSRGYPVKF